MYNLYFKAENMVTDRHTDADKPTKYCNPTPYEVVKL